MRRFENKRVLITGSARGIGRAIAERFARENAELLLTDLDGDELERTAEQLRAAGARVATYPLDVTDRAAVERTRSAVHADGGPIDLLVNNAGVVFGGPFLEVPLEHHELTYRVNVLGLVSTTHAFLGDLISRPEGHLVNVASASGLIGLPYGSTYASSKWAVIGFSESIRLELALQGHRHVGVTAVCPSYVTTGLFDGARPPRTTRMLTPERVADLLVRGVRRNRPHVRAPWLVKITPPLKGVLPTWLFDRISWIFGSTSSMKAWRGHESG